MAVKKDSPKRRKSIAVTNLNQRSIVPKGRRRAHSIVPGASLSPLAKARRSLVPRKSILKAPINLLNTEDSQWDSQFSQNSAQSQNSILDDINVTQSMDMTQDYYARVHDNTSRKSLGRRVSFAEHAHVRLFEKPDKNHTNSTSSPQSSPVVSPSSHQNVVTDENAYDRPTPVAGQHHSSVRHTVMNRKAEDMDLTSVAPLTFPISSGTAGSAILDEEFDYDDVDNDMEVTEVIRAELLRKRSLSLGGRQPLSQVGSSILSADESSDDLEETQSSIGNDSTTSDALSERSQAMEFTIPLNQSLRPPAHEDEAWLALRRATHSGNTPIEPVPTSDDDQDYPPNNGMDLGDAVQRLMRVRDSLSLPSHNEENTPDNMVQHLPHDETFSSIDESFEADADDGDRTMNISKVLGRASLNDVANARMSMGYQDSTMDESEIYATLAPKGSSIPRSSLLQQNLGGPSGQQLLKPSVFHPPPEGVDTQPSSGAGQTKQATAPIPFSFTPKASAFPSKPKPSTSKLDSPAKRKIKPVFSAAFAPPVTRPSPKKIATFSDARQLNKRPRDEDVENNPSPAKSQALKPLSPSKKALFQAPTVTPSASQTAPAVRRPSGYYARRKSLAPVPSIIPNKGIEDVLATVKSPKKKLGSGIGRASVGSTPVVAWDRASVSQKGKETSKTGEVDKLVVLPSTCEATQQLAVSSPTGDLLTPTSPRVNSAALVVQPSTTTSVVDFSTIVTSGFGEDEEADMDVDATEQWREGVEQGEYFEDDLPVISISQFFSMTGIKFMDELTAPRRSTHPSQQPTRQARNSSDIPLSEYVTAMAIDIPQLVLYSRVSKDLEAWMEKSKIVFAQAEDEASKVTPELFVEFSRADEDGQAELLHQLNLIRTNTRGLAKSDWYDWKLQWVEGLRLTGEKAFKALESDARALEGLNALADDLVPVLEKEYEAIMKELEKEQAEVAEIEACDQDYLNELKAEIAEQNIEVEALKAEVIEGNGQHVWLQQRLKEAEVDKQETLAAIATTERLLHIQKNSTRSEVFRLKDELEALENLHMFRVTTVKANMFEYVHASTFRVSIPCRNFQPQVSKIDITRFDKASNRYKDDFPQLSAFLLSSAKQLVVESDDNTVRQIVHRLGDYWSSCAQLRSQLRFLGIKYPIEIEVSQPSQVFKAKTMVMFPSIMGKAFISFIFSLETFSRWPMSIRSLDCEVEVAYGPIDRSAILTAVMERLSEATPSDNYACLLDACIEAQETRH